MTQPRPRCDDRSGAVVVIDVRHERRAIMRKWVEAAVGPGAPMVEEAADQVAASAAVERLGAHAVVVEIQLPVAQGLATIVSLRAAHPALRIIVCTFHHDATIEARAARAGADAYFVKPVGLRELRVALTGATA